MRRVGLMCAALLLVCSCSEKNASVTGSDVEKPAKPIRMAPETFEYSETPTVAIIPNGPVTGSLAGKAFTPGMIYFTPGMEKWAVRLIEKFPESPTDAGFGDDGMMLDIEFGLDPAQGKTFTKTNDYNDGIVSYYKTDGTIDSWSGKNSFAIEITEWEAVPFDASGESEFYVAGKASGYLAVCFETDGEDVPDSWAAGSFKDVPVLYQGAPFWTEED